MKKSIIENSTFVAVEEFLEGEGLWGNEKENSLNHILEKHFLNEEGLKARMKEDNLRVGSTFTMSFEDVVDSFYDMSEKLTSEIMVSDYAFGYAKIVLPGEGYALTFKGRGQYLKERCTEMCVVVRWDTGLVEGETQVTGIRIDTAFPVNARVKEYFRYHDGAF